MKIAQHVRLALLAVAALAASPAVAKPPPLDAYGDLPAVEDMAMSPSGKELAIIARIKGERQLIVLDSEHKVRASIPAKDAKIRDLRWAGENTVLLETSVTQALDPIFIADKAEIFGALVVPLGGKKPWLVFKKTLGVADAIFGDFGTRFVGGKWLGYFSGIEYANSKAGFDIVGSNEVLSAVDLENDTTHRLAELSAAKHRRSWLVDGNGRVAATFDIGETTGHWSITNEQGRTLASGVDPTGDVALVCFGRDGASAIYSLEDNRTGLAHLYEVPLAGGTPTEILAGLSIDRLYIDRTNGRLLGYRQNGETHRPVFFDPHRQSVVNKIFRAFPKLHVTLKDWTPDMSHLLVHTSGDGDSGTWFLVDMTKMKADPVGDDRPLVMPKNVGPISTITYHASDGLELDGILTLPPGREAKNLPVIMFPHGGPASHDEAVFDWWAQAFASRGYAVFQPNFRGSDNRDEAFLRSGYGQWGRKMQTDISDGLAELARRGIVDPKRACIMGASYGGYAALAGVTLQQGIYRCAVAVGAVSDLHDLYSTKTRESGDAKMTWLSLQQSLGQPSTFDEVSPRKHAAEADAPILIIHGKDDTVVPFEQGKKMADALQHAGKPYELVVMRKEDHWLSHADTRKQMLDAAMGFIQKYNPAD